MKLETRHFGELDISDETIIHFENGLKGFDDKKDFAIINNYDTEEPVPFFWLQSTEDPELTFVLTVPFIFKPDYQFELPEDVEKRLNIGPKSELGIYSIVRIPEQLKDFTYNLQAPIVVNYKTLEAEQIVLYDTSYTSREHFEIQT